MLRSELRERVVALYGDIPGPMEPGTAYCRFVDLDELVKDGVVLDRAVDRLLRPFRDDALLRLPLSARGTLHVQMKWIPEGD